MIRIQTTRRMRHFATIVSVDAPSATNPGGRTTSIVFAPPISNTCLADVTGGWVAPISAIRYFVQNATSGSVEDERFAGTTGKIGQLLRREVLPTDKITPFNNNPANTRAVLDYVVAFRLAFTLNGNTAAGDPDLYAPGTTTTNAAGGDRHPRARTRGDDRSRGAHAGAGSDVAVVAGTLREPGLLPGVSDDRQRRAAGFRACAPRARRGVRAERGVRGVLMAKRTRPLSRATRRRARGRARREGAVMLVVMLILMIATASAAISIHTTQSELQSAGEERIALQSRYASEAAMMTTIAYIDKLGDDTGGTAFAMMWKLWQQQQPPKMYEYAEPEVDPGNRHSAIRVTMPMEMAKQQTTEIAPLSGPVSGTGGGGGGGGGSGGGGSQPLDTLGSFGPRQAYGVSSIGYVVDINECQAAPSGLTPGELSGGGNKPGQTSQNFICTLTVHTQVQLPGATASRGWRYGAFTYQQDPFASEHDSRATILTPPVWQ